MRRTGKTLPLGVRVFLGLVAVNAAIGIVVLIAGGLGQTGGRILVTSLALTAAVMVGFACSTGRATPSLERAWLVGVACAAAGCAFVVAGVWSETENPTFWKITGTLVSSCVAIAVVSLTGLPTLPGRVRWTFVAAEALTATLWAMVVIGMWGEVDSSWFWRTFGAVAVGLAAFVLVIPVLARVLSKWSTAAAETFSTRVGFCPSCGRPLAGSSGGEITCPDCDATFTVRFRGRTVRPVAHTADRGVSM